MLMERIEKEVSAGRHDRIEWYTVTLSVFLNVRYLAASIVEQLAATQTASNCELLLMAQLCVEQYAVTNLLLIFPCGIAPSRTSSTTYVYESTTSITLG